MRRRTKAALVLPVVILLVGIVVLAILGELDEPEPQALRYSTEPSVWTVPPGRQTTAHVVLANVGNQSLDVSVWLAPQEEEARWLRIEPEFHKVTVPPRSQQRIPFTLHATLDADTSGGEAELTVAWTEKGHRFREDELLLVTTQPGAGVEPVISEEAVVLAGAAATGALLGGAAAWLLTLEWARLRAAFAAALYTRIGRSQSLENENRQKILATIEESPGIHFSEIRRRTSLANGLLYRHLRVLEDNGYVHSETQHGRRVYAPVGEDIGPPDGASPAERRILELLDRQPATQAELARELGISRQGVAFHLHNLVARGLVRKDLNEGTWRYSKT